MFATLRGDVLSTEAIEQGYDINAVIHENLEALRDDQSAHRVFGARGDEEVLGTVQLYWRDRTTAGVKRLYVRPASRGEGLGRSLMSRLVEAARTGGCIKLLLHAAPFTEAARSLNHDLGFEPRDPFECEVPESAYDNWVFMERHVNYPTLLRSP